MFRRPQVLAIAARRYPEVSGQLGDMLCAQRPSSVALPTYCCTADRSVRISLFVGVEANATNLACLQKPDVIAPYFPAVLILRNVI
jgi:hypothetical protein